MAPGCAAPVVNRCCRQPRVHGVRVISAHDARGVDRGAFGVGDDGGGFEDGDVAGWVAVGEGEGR